MKRFSEQFNKKANSIRLSAAEKRDLKDRVVSYMEYHPLSTGTNEAAKSYSVAGQQFHLVRFNAARLLRWSGALVVVLAVSTSFLAEKAVPGDSLYAIKVGFNEEIRSTMARTSYDKIVWETERLNRRISEARLLADAGLLTEEAEAKVASAVKVHSENARKEIENLKLTDKDEATLASIELTTALDVQNTSLRNRGASEQEGRSTDLIEIVLAESQAAEKTAEENNVPAYNKLIAKVESETTRAHELLAEIEDSATVEERKDVSRRLEDIERKVETAMLAVEYDDLAARTGLVAALQQTHRLIVFMTNIDVRANITVNEIVPVTLTVEERTSILEGKIKETKNLLRLSKEVISATSTKATTTVAIDKDTLAKVTPAISKISKSLAEAESLLLERPVNLEAAEVSGLEAYNLSLDISKLLNLSLERETSEEVEEPTEEVDSNDAESTSEENVVVGSSTAEVVPKPVSGV